MRLWTCVDHRLIGGAFFLGWLICLGAENLGAQQRAPTLVAPLACKGCGVVVRRTATIGGTDVPLVGLPRLVVEDGAGNLVVQARMVDTRPPLVFDSSGRYLGPLGRPGQGPGDVTPLQWIGTDSLGRVEVYSRNRVSVFSTNQEFISTRTLADFDKLPYDMVKLPGGGSLGISNLMGFERADLAPLVFRRADGSVIRRAELAEHKTGRPARAIALSSMHRKQAIWVVETPFIRGDGYDVTLVDTLGRPVTRFHQQVDWWWNRSGVSSRFTPIQDTVPTPYPWVQHAHEDAARRLLVLLTRPKQEWNAVKMADRWLEGNYFTVVEVVDPKDHRLLGSAQVRGFALNFISDRRFVTYREDRHGVPWIDVWTIEVSRSSS